MDATLPPGAMAESIARSARFGGPRPVDGTSAESPTTTQSNSMGNGAGGAPMLQELQQHQYMNHHHFLATLAHQLQPQGGVAHLGGLPGFANQHSPTMRPVDTVGNGAGAAPWSYQQLLSLQAAAQHQQQQQQQQPPQPTSTPIPSLTPLSQQQQQQQNSAAAVAYSSQMAQQRAAAAAGGSRRPSSPQLQHQHQHQQRQQQQQHEQALSAAMVLAADLGAGQTPMSLALGAAGSPYGAPSPHSSLALQATYPQLYASHLPHSLMPGLVPASLAGTTNAAAAGAAGGPQSTASAAAAAAVAAAASAAAAAATNGVGAPGGRARLSRTPSRGVARPAGVAGKRSGPGTLVAAGVADEFVPQDDGDLEDEMDLNDDEAYALSGEASASLQEAVNRIEAVRLRHPDGPWDRINVLHAARRRRMFEQMSPEQRDFFMCGMLTLMDGGDQARSRRLLSAQRANLYTFYCYDCKTPVTRELFLDLWGIGRKYLIRLRRLLKSLGPDARPLRPKREGGGAVAAPAPAAHPAPSSGGRKRRTASAPASVDHAAAAAAAAAAAVEVEQSGEADGVLYAQDSSGAE